MIDQSTAVIRMKQKVAGLAVRNLEPSTCDLGSFKSRRYFGRRRQIGRSAGKSGKQMVVTDN
jgi:hypothetical protein